MQICSFVMTILTAEPRQFIMLSAYETLDSPRTLESQKRDSYIDPYRLLEFVES